MARQSPRVIIVGAGFGGLWAARALARAGTEALLLDRNNFHVFSPLLYQVAAAELEPEAIVYPVRSIFRGRPNLRFAMTEVTGIDLEARLVKTAARDIQYDYLIVSTGSTSDYFGVPGAAQHALPLKTLGQAIGVRNSILCSFERAAQASDPERRRRLLTFVIVGGGPTGVEFAGALAELIRGPLAKDYPSLDLREARVVLLEATDRLLAALPQRLGAYAQERLTKMGVEAHVDAAVSEVGPEAVHLKDGTVIPSATTVWTAGVKGDPLASTSGLPVTRKGQVEVLPTLQIAEHPEVYVIGDVARVDAAGRPLPQLAPVAVQQGEAAAQNIARQIAGQAPEPFHYNDRGTMATIGRNAAVAHVGGREFTGFPAWVLWMGVHIFSLIGFRNRLLVLINWAWDYLFFERSLRLVMPVEQGPGPFEGRCSD